MSSTPLHSNEIVVYQPDATLAIDVVVDNDTVWLTQAQMAELFQTTRNNITIHIRNIFKEGELIEDSVCKESLLTAADGKTYKTKYYTLDVIISVGYRVKSLRGTQFRIWANNVLKEYLLKGYSFNQRLQMLEDRMDRRLTEQDNRIGTLTEKVDFFVRTSIPPKEGVLFNGQIFDGFTLISDLIRMAQKRVVLIDNYVDDRVLKLLDKRSAGVTAQIYTNPKNSHILLDIEKHNEQYPPIELYSCTIIHDRFLMIDDIVYFIGGSIKDLGKKLVAFCRMEMSPDVVITQIPQKRIK